MSAHSSPVADNSGFSLIPHAVGITSPPTDTFHEIPLTEGSGTMIYWPERNAFLAVYDSEFRALNVEADEHSKKIAALQLANQKVTEASIALRNAQLSSVKANIKNAENILQQALSDMLKESDEVKKKLEPLSNLDAKDGVKMVEIIALKKRYRAPLYVHSTSLTSVLADNRIYMVGEADARTKEKLIKDGKLNSKEIKHRITEKVQEKAKFSKEWKLKPEDADEYAGVLSDWANTMNSEMATIIERKKSEIDKKYDIDATDPRRRVDLSADAQLMVSAP